MSELVPAGAAAAAAGAAAVWTALGPAGDDWGWLLAHIAPCLFVVQLLVAPPESAASWDVAAVTVSSFPLHHQWLTTSSLAESAAVGVAYLAVLLGIRHTTGPEASSSPLLPWAGLMFSIAVCSLGRGRQAGQDKKLAELGAAAAASRAAPRKNSDDSSTGKDLDHLVSQLQCSISEASQTKFRKHFPDHPGGAFQFYNLSLRLRVRHFCIMFMSRTHLCIYGRSLGQAIHVQIPWNNIQSVSRGGSLDPFIDPVHIVLKQPQPVCQGGKPEQSLELRFFSKNAKPKLEAMRAWHAGERKTAIYMFADEIEPEASADEDEDDDDEDLNSIITEGLTMQSIVHESLEGVQPHHLDTIHSKLLVDDWDELSLLGGFLRSCESKDIVAAPWVSVANDGGMVREVKMVVAVPKIPLPPPFGCPPQTRVTTTYRVARRRNCVVLESSSESHDVPFGGYFTVQERNVIRSDGDGVLFEKSVGCHFVRGTMLKKIIESETHKKCAKIGQLLAQEVDRAVGA
mmetsp:Transcript_92373/g.211437  ORF Transcript_92373/g.211437 Transcript_92373/m.211437 type:complete len:514 (-) Transcript_92373:100-1641(-)